MIIKGKSRAAAGQAGKYLLDIGKNERTELIEIAGTISQDVKNAVKEMEAVAAGSRCEKFLFHASINLKEGEALTPEQWKVAADLLEKNLGLEGHQRIIVEHEKDNRTHHHILWNRVNPDTMKAVHMSNSYAAHEMTARQLERDFGLEAVKGVHVVENVKDKRAERGPTHNEIKEAEKSGVKLYKWREEIRDLAKGENGAEVIAALEAKGHMVARGEKVDFVILDPSGNPHRMAQSLGLRVKDLKEKLSGIDPAKLPDVATAQEWQKDRLADIERNKETKRGAGMYDRGSMASQQLDAMQHIKDKAKAREKNAEPEKARAIGKEKVSQNTPQQSQPEKPRENYSQRASLLRDIAPEAAAKQARTEQKDAKKEKSAAAAMREVFETNYSRKPSGSGRDPRDNDRERERER